MGTMIDYDHALNTHTPMAPEAIVKIILEQHQVSSVLDVGCGTGVWLKEFLSHNVKDVYGVDGVPIKNREFEVSTSLFSCVDLRSQWNLHRHFDLAICLEVAEHLPLESAPDFIRSLCTHSNLIVFSAACPHQEGQGHINCQWPSYWQQLFNMNSYLCADSLRPFIWDQEFPEYWYKQNIFVAMRDPAKAGSEARLPSLVHPEFLQSWVDRSDYLASIIERRKSHVSSALLALKMLKSLWKT